MNEKILIVDDEEELTVVLEDVLKNYGYKTVVASTIKDARSKMNDEDLSLVLCDLKLPDGDGLELLSYIKEEYDLPVIMITGYASVDTAVKAIKMGAENYIKKPFHFNELMMVIKKSLDTTRLKKENRKLQEMLYGENSFEGIVSSSSKMKNIFELIRKISTTDATVLIQGESGTGKELIAKAIHNTSLRSSKPFIPINCSGLPVELLESELFGYKKGAFTGAYKDKEGLFVAANWGTLFLDEVVDTPPPVQAKLLRVLQEGTFIPLGSVNPVKVDVRIISASNKDLYEAVKEGRFREDLYYRLNVVRIDLPPLRERREDILLLADHFIKKYSVKHHKEVKYMDNKVKNMLLRYNWPGNVRELENVIEQAVALSSDSTITVDNLPSYIFDKGSSEDDSYYLVHWREAKKGLKGHIC